MAQPRRMLSVSDPAYDVPSKSVKLTVSGFKAVRRELTLDVRPLTLIAGSNSSGKSSFMQPFLLMKQTVEADFDPGPLLLNGPNVKFTEHAQLFSRGKAKTDTSAEFSAGIQLHDDVSNMVTFRATPTRGIYIESSVVTQADYDFVLRENLRPADVLSLKKALQDEVAGLLPNLSRQKKPVWEPVVFRNRCFLEGGARIDTGDGLDEGFMWQLLASRRYSNFVRSIIHVPGLRGNPERAYPRSAVGDTFPGTFEKYVASIVHVWAEKQPKRLQALADDLHELGLTWKVLARRLDDASVELLVGRMPNPQQGGAHDLVSVADVGFGVSQTLPVLVSLLIAKPGQIVYLEQPEIHLHPRAQIALAGCLVRAARRGVFVVAETHSSLLLRAIQTAIASDKLQPADVSMNWFGRDADTGVTDISVAEIDEAGALGDWPVDFDDVAQSADWAYLDAAAMVEGSD